MLKSILKTSSIAVLSFVLSTTVGHSVANSAQIASLGQPVGEWIVGPINVNKTKKNSLKYCSMKNRFNSNMILVLAQEASGKLSIALDFQENLLQVGDQYDVVMNLDGGVTREVISAAVTSQIMIMQMGKDTSFLRALKSRNKLDVSMPGASVSFSLKGTSVAISSLEQCIASLSGKKQIKKVDLKKAITVTKRSANIPAKIIKKITKVSFVEETLPVMPKAEKLASVTPIVVKTSVKMDEVKPPESVTNNQAKLALNGQLEKVDAEKEQVLAKNESLISEIASLSQVKKELSKKNQKLSLQNSSLLRENNSLKGENTTLSVRLRQIAKETTRGVSTAENCQASVRLGQKNTSVDLLKELLITARVASTQNIRSQKSPVAGKSAYSWQTGSLYGGAYQLDWPVEKAFRQMSKDYVGMVKQRCAGDFAYTMGATELISGVQFMETEFSCIDNKENPAAAVLFYGSDGVFTVVTHEGTTDQMYQAITRRDAVLSVARRKNTN